MPEQYSIEEFGQKIKERYPEYQNIDNKQLGQKMLEKYPEYSDRVNLQPSSQTKSSPSTNYSSNSSSSSTKSDGFLKSMVKSIAKPFSEVGTSIYNVGSSIKSLASGDVQGAAQELDKTRNIPFLGETKPKNADEILGSDPVEEDEKLSLKERLTGRKDKGEQ